jgi:hypothetical protein
VEWPERQANEHDHISCATFRWPTLKLKNLTGYALTTLFATISASGRKLLVRFEIDLGVTEYILKVRSVTVALMNE